MEWGIALLIAGIMATVSGTANAIGNQLQINDEIDELGQQIRDQEDKRQDVLDDLDLKFKVAEDEAQKNADKADRQTDLSEKQISDELNADADQLALKEFNEAFIWNEGEMAIGNQKGQELAGMAQSGARTSSMSDAIAMEEAVNRAQLEAQKLQERTANEYAMKSIYNGLVNTTANLQFRRDEAEDLRNSYKEGGNNWKLYDSNRTLAKNDYDRYIRNLSDKKASMEDAGWRWGQGLKAFFGAGNQAFTSTYNFASNFTKDVNYQKTLNLK